MHRCRRSGRACATPTRGPGPLPLAFMACSILLAALALLGKGAGAAPYPAFRDMASPEALRIAEHILSWQLPSGGWGKDLPIAERPWQPGTPKSAQAAAGVELGSFDNDATTSEIRFLAGAYAATGDERYLHGFLRGAAFVFEAETPSGGWPQVHPRRGNYSDEVTFNDGAMVRVMELLLDISRGSPPFGFAPTDLRERAKAAFERGLDYIVAAQIEQGGRLLAWGQQHDPVTYAPRPGRAYEPASLASAESAEIVRLLMAVPDPPRAVRRAILAALLWLEEAELADGRWARLYEIGTNRPIFAGRDGVIRYDLAEVEAERRTGYAWYGTWPRELLQAARRSGALQRLYDEVTEFQVPLVTLVRPRPSPTPVAGMIDIEVEVKARSAAPVGRVEIRIGGEPVFQGSLPPAAPVAYDTRKLADGRHELSLEVTYGEGETTRRVAAITVRNRWERRIALAGPVDRGWFGLFDPLGTTGRSSGWRFVEGDEGAFFGDRDRAVPEGAGEHFLEWEAPRLESVEAVVYTRQPVLGRVRFLGASVEGWIELPPVEIVEEMSPTGLRKVRLAAAGEGRLDESGRVRVVVEGSSDLEIQLGEVFLRGLL